MYINTIFDISLSGHPISFPLLPLDFNMVLNGEFCQTQLVARIKIPIGLTIIAKTSPNKNAMCSHMCHIYLGSMGKGVILMGQILSSHYYNSYKFSFPSSFCYLLILFYKPLAKKNVFLTWIQHGKILI